MARQGKGAPPALREDRSGTSAAGWPAPVAYVPQVLGHRIVYCPLYAAAPALLEALQVAWADADSDGRRISTRRARLALIDDVRGIRVLHARRAPARRAQ